MSVEIYSNVLDLDMDARRKLALAVLADHADEDGLCWPSQALIARRASISIRKLRAHLRGLESEGWLKTFVNKGPREVNYYQLNVSKIAGESGIERHRITVEKERKRVKFSDAAFVTPDCTDTLSSPDFQSITPDFADITPDLESIDPGPQGPTEPSKKRKGTAREPSGHSINVQEKVSTSEPTEAVKTSAKERLRGWAQLEQSEASFSDRQRTSLQKSLEYACAVLPQPELLLDLWAWDFLDDNAKAHWRERVEHPYSTDEG